MWEEIPLLFDFAACVIKFPVVQGHFARHKKKSLAPHELAYALSHSVARRVAKGVDRSIVSWWARDRPTSQRRQCERSALHWLREIVDTDRRERERASTINDDLAYMRKGPCDALIKLAFGCMHWKGPGIWLLASNAWTHAFAWPTCPTN
jgi:hypothetical protein